MKGGAANTSMKLTGAAPMRKAAPSRKPLSMLFLGPVKDPPWTRSAPSSARGERESAG